MVGDLGLTWMVAWVSVFAYHPAKAGLVPVPMDSLICFSSERLVSWEELKWVGIVIHHWAVALVGSVLISPDLVITTTWCPWLVLLWLLPWGFDQISLETSSLITGL